jgi:hypothetical protein
MNRIRPVASLFDREVGIRLTPVSAGSGGAVGQTIVVCRLSSLARTQGRQTTENDGPPHEAAGTQPR